MNRRSTTILSALAIGATAFCLGWTSSRHWSPPRGPEVPQEAEAREVLLGAPIVLVDGRRCVVAESRYPDGSLASRCPILEMPGHDGSYSMGPYEYHGVWTAYHRNGVASEVGAYVAGAKHGAWRRWDEQGVLLAEEVCRGGRPIVPNLPRRDGE